MKVCSFLPAATQMIQAMNLDHYLCGVTFECKSDRPKVVRSILEGNRYSSREIDIIVSESKAKGENLYWIDEELLQSLAPDVIFTQDVCDVCQIDTSLVMRSVHKLKKAPLMVPLIPRTLEDVYQNMATIAKTLGQAERAERKMVEIHKRENAVLDKLRNEGAPLKRVMVMEFLDPIYNCGHWIPYQIAKAGGVDMLSNPAGYSVVTEWEKIRRYNPEVLVVSPCGFDVERTLSEIHILKEKEGWYDILAVKNGAVFVADSQFFTQPSETLVDGIEMLAGFFHPELFQVPSEYRHFYRRVA